MAIEKLALATISGPLEQFDQAVRQFVLDRQFHPESATSLMPGMKHLMAFDMENPYTELIARLDAIERELGITPKYKAYDDDFFSLDKARDYIRTLEEAMESLLEERRRLSLAAADNQNIIETLSHIRNVDEELDEFLEMRSVKFRFGRIPRTIYDEARARIDARQDTFFIHTSIEPDYIYCMYFALPSAREKVDAFFAALHFERIWISDKVQGTPEEAVARLTAEMEEARLQEGRINLRLEALRDTNEGRLAQYRTYLAALSEANDLKAYAGHTEENFYLVGWIPQREAESYAAAIERLPGFSCVLSEAEDIPDVSPPIRQRLGVFTRIYRPFVEMYGLPDYREIDPSFFMALTYTVLFGVMFGDVGQGLVLILAGLIMRRAMGMWIGSIVSCVGVSATAFGFVYGSVFGYEHLLPGFKVLEGGGPNQILLISAGVGIALILVCMLLNMVNGFRQRDPGKSLFSSNGLAGMVFYVAVVFGVAGIFLLDMNVFSTPYVLGLIVLPLVLMLCHEPLSKLLRREPGWLPESPGSFLVEGVFELFEVALSFVSNTISFLRVGAFAISHAGMMMVVFLLAETASGYNPVVLVIGNLFITALEALLVCIQLLRLEFYEMFGRFYSGGGRKFTPHRAGPDRP